jgi:excisionase family DNA binding protein
MSVQEMSVRLGIRLPKAYALVHSPGFPVMRVGKRILIPVREFFEWIKNTMSPLDPSA